MGDGSAGVVWFAAPGFRVLSIDDSQLDVVVSIETTADRVGCIGCGVIARAKDRRWVTSRDAPSADRPVTVRWRKRVWCCPDAACEVNSWTEQRRWRSRVGCSPNVSPCGRPIGSRRSKRRRGRWLESSGDMADGVGSDHPTRLDVDADAAFGQEFFDVAGPNRRSQRTASRTISGGNR